MILAYSPTLRTWYPVSRDRASGHGYATSRKPEVGLGFVELLARHVNDALLVAGISAVGADLDGALGRY